MKKISHFRFFLLAYAIITGGILLIVPRALFIGMLTPFLVIITFDPYTVYGYFWICLYVGMQLLLYYIVFYKLNMANYKEIGSIIRIIIIIAILMPDMFVSWLTYLSGQIDFMSGRWLLMYSISEDMSIFFEIKAGIIYLSILYFVIAPYLKAKTEEEKVNAIWKVAKRVFLALIISIPVDCLIWLIEEFFLHRSMSTIFELQMLVDARAGFLLWGTVLTIDHKYSEMLLLGPSVTRIAPPTLPRKPPSDVESIDFTFLEKRISSSLEDAKAQEKKYADLIAKLNEKKAAGEIDDFLYNKLFKEYNEKLKEAREQRILNAILLLKKKRDSGAIDEETYKKLLMDIIREARNLGIVI